MRNHIFPELLIIVNIHLAMHAEKCIFRYSCFVAELLWQSFCASIAIIGGTSEPRRKPRLNFPAAIDIHLVMHRKRCTFKCGY